MLKITRYCFIALAGACLPAANVSATAQAPSLMSILAPVKEVPSAESIKTTEVNTVKQSDVVETHDTVLVEVPLEVVLEKLQDVVGRELEEGCDLNLVSRAIWKPFEVEKDAEWDLVLKNRFSPDTTGRWYASFDIYSGNDLVTSRNLRVDASLFQEVWLTGRRLERGDSLNPSSGMQPVLRDVFLERGRPIPVGADLTGYELVRNVTEGQLLKWDDLKLRPSVRRGNLVDVVVQQGPMTVIMRGRSLEDGLKGDLVCVRNVSSNRDLIGKVIGTDQVQFIPRNN